MAWLYIQRLCRVLNISEFVSICLQLMSQGFIEKEGGVLEVVPPGRGKSLPWGRVCLGARVRVETVQINYKVNLLDVCLADSKIPYFWQVLEYTHKFIIELHDLQCLIVRKSKKQQKRSRIISNLTKGQNFSSFVTAKCSWDSSHNAASLLAPSKKGLPLFSLLKKRIYLDTQLKGDLMFPLMLPWCFLFPQAE